MAVKCQTIINIVEQLAPRYLAEEWDNVGLQVGNPAGEVDKVLVCLDVNQEVAREAIAVGAGLIVSHHPLIFKPLKNLRRNNPQGELLYTLIQNDISVYSAHTNLDSAAGGVNQVLAEKLGLQDIEVLSSSYNETYCKMVVFVPVGHEDAVRNAMAEAGAGWIGNYSHCTFQLHGTGTFKPLEGANPFIGSVGDLEKVAEYRLETIVPQRAAGKVVKAMLKAHPYEEVAYDLYPLLNEGAAQGLGRIGRFLEAIPFGELVKKVKDSLEVDKLIVGGDLNRSVQKIAVCGGSGASLLHKALFMGAQVLLTGDVKYHEGQEMLAQGLNFIDGGHHATERPVVSVLADFLREKAQANKFSVDIVVSEVNTNPFVSV
ncbi:MAG: Nif3-like dinuclear metal center hexameric protein [Clostridia bacterium]|nr:Nif3-like dinuclear metal center hexameric protein [Clostridia bacterium]